MPHHDRIRPIGFWVLASVIDPAELETLDAAQAAEIDGDAGGTWAPSTPIALGGSGLSLTGPTLFKTGSDPHVQSGVTATIDAGGFLKIASVGTLKVDAGAFLNLESSAQLSGKSGSQSRWATGSEVNFDAGCDLDIDADITSTGANTWSGAQVIAGGSLTIDSTSVLTAATGASALWGGSSHNFAGPVTLAVGSSLTVQGPVTRSGAAATKNERVGVDLTDASQTIDTSQDIYVIALPAAARTISLKQTPAPTHGSKIHLVYHPGGSAAFQINIDREGGGTIGAIPASATSAHFTAYYDANKGYYTAHSWSSNIGSIA